MGFPLQKVSGQCTRMVCHFVTSSHVTTCSELNSLASSWHQLFKGHQLEYAQLLKDFQSDDTHTRARTDGKQNKHTGKKVRHPVAFEICLAQVSRNFQLAMTPQRASGRYIRYSRLIFLCMCGETAYSISGPPEGTGCRWLCWSNGVNFLDVGLPEDLHGANWFIRRQSY